MLGLVFLIMAFLVALFLLNFYRDPERTIPKGNNIVAPADGRIISIINTSKRLVKVKKGFLGKIRTLTKDVADKCYVVSIFMSPLDVHINRAPMQGVIKSIRHRKGRFFMAHNVEKSFENEKNEIVIQNKRLKIKMIQVAGFIARRIKCHAKANQKVNKGQKIGSITLGSQTSIVFPSALRLNVRVNQKVKAGESIIAEMV